MSENPYQTPAAADLHSPAALDPDRAVELRAEYRSTERLVRSIGLVYFVQALVVVVLAVALSMPVGRLLQLDSPAALATLSSLLYLFGLATIIGVAGFGLRTLATWSRLCALIQTFYLLAGFMFGLYSFSITSNASFTFAVYHALPFYILFSPKAGYVLSRGYAGVCAATRGARPRSIYLAIAVTILLAGLVVLDITLFPASRP